MVPVVEASFNLSGPAGQWLAGRQDQIVHVAGVPLSSIRIDCRLGVVVPSGCDGVDVVVVGGKAQLVLLPVCERTMGLSRCTVAPRLQFTWKRGPLAPVVVVGAS